MRWCVQLPRPAAQRLRWLAAESARARLPPPRELGSAWPERVAWCAALAAKQAPVALQLVPALPTECLTAQPCSLHTRAQGASSLPRRAAVAALTQPARASSAWPTAAPPHGSARARWPLLADLGHREYLRWEPRRRCARVNIHARAPWRALCSTLREEGAPRRRRRTVRRRFADLSRGLVALVQHYERLRDGRRARLCKPRRLRSFDRRSRWLLSRSAVLLLNPPSLAHTHPRARAHMYANTRARANPPHA